MDLTVIPITDDIVFNYFFTIQVYCSIYFVGIFGALSLLRK